MLDTIWEQLRARLRESEVNEAKYLLGRERVERTEDVVQEIESLLGLFDEIPSQFKDLTNHKQKVEFYLNKLAGKARELGVNTSDLIGLKTPRDRFIFEFLAEGASTRPSTADSSRFTGSIPGLESINEYNGKMVTFIEDHQAELKCGIDSEYEFLTAKATAVQNELIGIASIPSVKEVSEFTKKLEEAVVNEIHPALFQLSGKVSKVQNEQQELKEDWDFEFEIEKPRGPICKPKLREIKKPVRPVTPAVREELNTTTQSFGNGKMSRRLRSLVKDHHDLPM